ncbi:hypothetical protein GUJ93_ZPchr0005g14577 [Zizania palustris]|uniref:Uncharacterized protein n=1 Tax=Zizania palustris TaxID=103762 RepID=A0A8J5S5R3_ZIZPA|nr:hypothetical protein GUJ93_ZPchr0005g14577 [Zizania palustris]
MRTPTGEVEVMPMKGDKYNDQEPNVLDLLKECHYSKKKGYRTDVVVDVLATNTKKNQFLQNVGFQRVSARSSLQNVQAQLEAQKAEKIELSKQLEEMKKKQADLEAKHQLVLSKVQSSEVN